MMLNLFEAAKAGDRDAMNATVLSYAWWVKSRRVPWVVDPCDAESAAWEGVWRGILNCQTPEDVPRFAYRVYRNQVHDCMDRIRNRREFHGVEWGRLIGGFTFPCDLVGLAVACIACGTTGGYRRGRCLRPGRIRGMCNACYRQNHAQSPSTR